MALGGPSMPLYLSSGHSSLDELFPQSLRRLKVFLGEMHLSVQQIKHCSGGHILPSLPLWLSLPVSWCSLAHLHNIIYSPITLHDYYTDNMKLNYSLTVVFPSSAGKWTTWHYRGIMKHSPLSLFLLFLWKVTHIEYFFPFLYKAKF